MNSISNLNTDKINQRRFSFQGTLQQNLRLGEKHLKNFQDEFAFHVRSSTRLQAKIDEHKDNPRYEKIIPKLKKLLSFYEEDIDGFRHSFNQSLKFNSVDKIIDAIKQSKIANCPHQSELVANSLKKSGANVQRLTMVIKGGKENVYHIFPIVDMLPKANLDKVGTWGKNAVIVDPWSNYSGKAKDVIDYFLRDVFKVDGKKQKVSFMVTQEPF